MPKRAHFITFEGIEGAGKSTQVRAVEAHYRGAGLSVFYSREPGGSPLSNGIRDVLLRSSGIAIDPISELLLIEAARRQHVVDVLSKALPAHDLVLCDRFTDSSLAYQGGGRRLDLAWIKSLNERAAEGLTPDLTILLDAPVERALSRALARISSDRPGAAEDRFEREDRSFHERVRETYLRVAKDDPKRFLVLDASKPAEELTASIVRKIDLLRKNRT